jgi:hypothetical protein
MHFPESFLPVFTQPFPRLNQRDPAASGGGRTVEG